MAFASLLKSAPHVSWLTGAIAGGLIAASTFAPSTRLGEFQAMQFVNRNEPPQPVETVNPGAVLAIAFGMSVALCLGANAVLDRKGPPARANQPRSNPYLQIKAGESHVRQLKPSLQRRLLLLLHQDQQAAERLLRHASLKSPGQSLNWYAEKVIYDLERDRG